MAYANAVVPKRNESEKREVDFFKEKKTIIYQTLARLDKSDEVYNVARISSFAHGRFWFIFPMERGCQRKTKDAVTRTIETL